MSIETMSLKDATQQMQAVEGNLKVGLHGLDIAAALMTDAFFAGQHILLEGDPGIGKTALASNLAESLDTTTDEPAPYAYILGVGDRMPADVLGTEIYLPGSETFRVRRGPIFRNVVVADEINRFPGKTQAAFHEAMDSRTVTIGEERLYLPDPFFVVGTQNEHAFGQSTNPTSDALLDRFAVSHHYPAPSANDRFAVGKALATSNGVRPAPKKLINVADTLELKQVVKGISVEEIAIKRAAKALAGLAENKSITVKANGHRTMGSAIRMAQARALRNGGGKVDLDTMKSILPYVMRHRFDVDSADGEAAKQQIISDILNAA